MATRTIESQQQATPVGTAGTKINTSTKTTFELDSNGKVTSSKTELIYYEGKLGTPPVAAVSTDGGKTWTYNNKPLSNTPWLGEDAKKSLEQGALKNNVQQQIQDSAKRAGLTQEQTKAISSGPSTGADTNIEQGRAALTQSLESNDKTRNSFPGAGGQNSLRYPANLQIEHQDVIKFNMVKYSPRKFSTGDSFGFDPRRSISKEDIIGSVILPIQSNISDTSTVTWGEDRMDAGQAILANIALSGILGGGESAAETAGSSIDNIKSNIGESRAAVAGFFAEQASQVTGILARTQGAVNNPNLELLFQGPTLRPFSFTFRLSARGTADREAIRRIIRLFKQGMAVQRTKSNLFLKAPHTFKIQYLHKASEHPYINRIKECALQSFSVNYTPENNYMTFSDGLMTSYEIQMQFSELEPIYNDDYSQLDQNNDTAIGY